MPDPEFFEMIGTPIADLSPRRLEACRKWVLIVHKKISYAVTSLCKKYSLNLTPDQQIVFTASIWEMIFRVPLIELLQEEGVLEKFQNGEIRPMNIDELFKEKTEILMRDA